MKNVPDKIYLQIDADGETPEDFSELAGVSWCADKINDNDIEYVLAAQQSGDGWVSVEELRQLYKNWCKETKRNGGVLVGGSINEFFDWLSANRMPLPAPPSTDKQ
jgi:hypothetical protein